MLHGRLILDEQVSAFRHLFAPHHIAHSVHASVLIVYRNELVDLARNKPGRVTPQLGRDLDKRGFERASRRGQQWQDADREQLRKTEDGPHLPELSHESF
jgi:hypothetical protein